MINNKILKDVSESKPVSAIIANQLSRKLTKASSRAS